MLENNIKYHDISPEISEKIAVWPGDVKFKRSTTIDFKSGGNLLLSSFQTTVHLGAHTDAPSHYHPHGDGIDKRNLNYYLGSCQVITISKSPGERIFPEDLLNRKILTKRILFKTLSFPNSNHWNHDFVSLSPELIQYLAKQGVILVGIDTPSVDPFDDQQLLTHQAIYQHNIAILEGIVLAEVPDHVYTLIALPLRLKDADASPVRAILVSNFTL